MRSRTLCTHLLVASGLCVASVAVAHENDPKGAAKRVAYDGPSWRSGVDGGLARGFDSLNIELAANITMSEIDAGQEANDIWGYTSSSGREYAIFGTTSGTSFIEVTVPSNPQIVGYIDGPNSLWRDMKVYDEYAYIVSEGGGNIQIVSLANIDSGSVTLVGSVGDGGTTASHNVAIDPVSGILARCGGSNNGIRLYSLAGNPANPQYVGAWNDEYVHDAQIHTMTTGPYAGRVIAFCNAGLNGGSINTGLDIIDVTNPASPVRLGGMEYPGAEYSHQGWLSADEQYFYINDELYSGTSSTFIVDVSDLTNPQFVTRYTNGNASICHNLYVKGNLIYAANYRSGLRVLDCSNPTSLVEVAYFDTFPSSDSASFNGAWSNYPFFASGTIIVSDIESGLFVFANDVVSVNFSIVGNLPDPVASSGESITVDISATGIDLDPSTALALVNDGTGQQDVPMTFLGGSSYSVELPDLACPGTVTVSFAILDVSNNELFQSTGSSASIADGVEVTTISDGESNAGFSVSGNATDGQWDRGVPVNCSQDDPDSDGDGSGQCWLTDNSSANGCDSDVDGGFTRLTSPAIDASNGENATVSYSRYFSSSGGGTECPSGFLADCQGTCFPIEVYNDWQGDSVCDNGSFVPSEYGYDNAPEGVAIFLNCDEYNCDDGDCSGCDGSGGGGSGGSGDGDYLVVEITNNGSTWVEMDRIESGDTGEGSWVAKSFLVQSFVTPTATVQVRFTAVDAGDDTVVEAGVDGIALDVLVCDDDTVCIGDLNGDNVVDGIDLSLLLGSWGPGSGIGDINADGSVNGADLSLILGNWGVCLDN